MRKPYKSKLPATRTSDQPDPTLVAIETHRRAWANLCRDVSRLTEAADEGDDKAEQKLNQLHEAINAGDGGEAKK